jgi:trigger factor
MNKGIERHKKMIKSNSNKTKIMGLMLVFCLVLALAACGSKDTDYVEPYDYDLSEYVTLGDYTGIKVTESAISVSAEEIQAEIQTRLQTASTTIEKKEGLAEIGQNVNISYVGKIDGKEFEGGSTGAGGATITLGNSGYIEGFDDGVIGMKVGEIKALDLKFPEDYWNKDLANKPVEFTVTLNFISVSNVPEYNLEFIKTNSEYTTVKDYEKSVKKDLLATKEAAEAEEMSNTIWATVMDNAEILKYPETELQASKDTNRQYYEDYAENYGMEFAEFVTMYTGMTEAEYDEYLKEYAEAIVAQEMVMYSIARKEGITIGDSEYDKMLKEFMAEQGFESDEDFKSAYGTSFEEYAGKGNIMKSFMLEKVLDFVNEKSVKVPSEEITNA